MLHSRVQRRLLAACPGGPGPRTPGPPQAQCETVHVELLLPFLCAINTGVSDQGKYTLAYGVVSKDTKETLWPPKHPYDGPVPKPKFPHVSFCFLNSWGKLKSLWEVSHHKLFSPTVQGLSDSPPGYTVGAYKRQEVGSKCLRECWAAGTGFGPAGRDTKYWLKELT